MYNFLGIEINQLKCHKRGAIALTDNIDLNMPNNPAFNPDGERIPLDHNLLKFDPNRVSFDSSKNAHIWTVNSTNILDSGDPELFRKL